MGPTSRHVLTSENVKASGGADMLVATDSEDRFVAVAVVREGVDRSKVLHHLSEIASLYQAPEDAGLILLK